MSTGAPALELVTCFNPLLHIGHYSVRMAKISILEQEGMNKKISYERRVYGSVDENSLS